MCDISSKAAKSYWTEQTQTYLSSLHSQGPYQEGPAQLTKTCLWGGGRIHTCSEHSAFHLQGHPHPWVFTIGYYYDTTINWAQTQVHLRSRKVIWLLLRVLTSFRNMAISVLFPCSSSSLLSLAFFFSFLSYPVWPWPCQQPHTEKQTSWFSYLL